MPPKTPRGKPRLTDAPTIKSNSRVCECKPGGILKKCSTEELNSAVTAMHTTPIAV
jgi:hypothetical protein